MGNCLRLLVVQQQHSSTRLKRIEDDVEQLQSVFTHHHAASDIEYNHTSSRKKVRFSDDEEEGGNGRSLRVKLVISKEKLKEMMANGGVSIEGMVSEMVKLQNQENVQVLNFDNSSVVSGKAWKPALKSIPEVEYYS